MGAQRIDRQTGFTLVELLTVLTIIALLSSAVILTIPERKSDAEQFAETMAVELNLAAQESLITGRPSALGLSQDSYGLMVYEGGAWDVRQERLWRDGVSVRMLKDKSNIKLGDDLVPLAVFYPTGNSTIFELSLSGLDANYTLSSTGDGRVVLEQGA